MTTTTTAPEFLGRAAARAQCDKCGRELGMTYLLRVDGTEVVMGRRCASRAMGWAVSRFDMMVKQAERIAELDRRRAVIFSERPDLAEAWDARWENPTDPRVNRIVTVCAEDTYWDGRNWHGTWQEYLDRCAAAL